MQHNPHAAHARWVVDMHVRVWVKTHTVEINTPCGSLKTKTPKKPPRIKLHIFIRLTFIILFVFPSLSCFSHLVWYHYLCHFNSHPPPPPRCIDFQTRNKNKPTVKHTENCHSSPRTPQAKEHSAKGRRHMEGVYCSRCCSRSSLCCCLQKTWKIWAAPVFIVPLHIRTRA